MDSRLRTGGLIVALTVLALPGGCASGSTIGPVSSPARTTAPSAPLATPTPTGTATPGSITFQEFHESFCSAWESLFRGVGNPDLGEGSALTDSMDAAISAGDIPSVDRLAAEIAAELEAGRQEVAVAMRWAPAAPMMVQIDRVFVGFEAMTEAKRAAASQGLGIAATQRGQEALEQSGAIDAWFALIRPGVLDETRQAIQSARPADGPTKCANIPIGL